MFNYGDSVIDKRLTKLKFYGNRYFRKYVTDIKVKKNICQGVNYL